MIGSESYRPSEKNLFFTEILSLLEYDCPQLLLLFLLCYQTVPVLFMH